MAEPTPSTPTFLQRFTVLRGAVRELWITFAVKLLGIVAYKTMSVTLVLWLSADLGFSDTKASSLYGLWSAGMTLFTVMVGSLTDAIGLRKSFLLGVVVCIAARATMTFSTTAWVALAAGLFPLALGEALGTPVLVAAVRRYSTTAQRSISFAVFYSIMNVGFLIANIIFDYLRWGLGEHGRFALPFLGIEMTTYRALFLISLLFEVVMLPIIYFGLRDGVEATDEGVKIQPEPPKYPGQGTWTSLRLMLRDAARDTVRIFIGLWGQPGFHKFLGFLTLAAFMRLIMVHMDVTFPKFGIRELGEGAPVGRLWGINSLLIIFMVPVVGALSQQVSAYRMVTLGTAVAASSVFIMAMPPSWFAPLADGVLGDLIGRRWLGVKGTVDPYYVMIFIYVVLLSLGEAVYSPRLYEYAAAIAPKGQEASYMALSLLPLFLAKLPVGIFSGILLEKYCPAAGPRESNRLWLIIALTTVVAPIGLVVFRRWLRVQEAGREN